MFSLINLILTIIVLVRVYKYDKFYMLTYNWQLKEMDKTEKEKRYRGNKQ